MIPCEKKPVLKLTKICMKKLTIPVIRSVLYAIEFTKLTGKVKATEV